MFHPFSSLCVQSVKVDLIFQSVGMAAPDDELDLLSLVSCDSSGFLHRHIIDVFAMDEEEEAEQHNNSWSEGQIASNTKMTVLPGAELASHPSCVVCLVDFQAGEEVMKMRHCPCSQPFHKLCLVTWLRGRGYCPYCRSVGVDVLWGSKMGKNMR